jgi:hypothetical protein
MDRYFTPMAVLTALALDVGFNSLAEPLHAHISIVILITCLQVICSAMRPCSGCSIETGSSVLFVEARRWEAAVQDCLGLRADGQD